MNNKIKSLAIILMLLFGSISALYVKPCAAPLSQREIRTEVKGLIDGVLEFRLKETATDSVQDYIDNYLTENVGGSAEWYIQALLSYSAVTGAAFDTAELNFEKYKSSLLNYIEHNEIKSAASREKCAMVLMKLHNLGYVDNRDVTIAFNVLKDSVGQLGVMSYIYGLHLANELINDYSADTDTAYLPENIINELISLQREDGGWSIRGQYGDVDVTAMTLQALAPHKDNYTTEVERGVEFLSSHQQPAGDFASYGSNNAESTAQTIQALTLLGIDICSDERFIKNDNTALDGLEIYLLPDGSFCHVTGAGSNPTATVQVLYALADYYSLLLSEPVQTDLGTINSSSDATGTMDSTRPTATEAADSARPTANETADTTRPTATGAVDSTRPTANGAADTTRPTATGAVDSTQPTATGAADTTRPTANETADSARPTANGAVDSARPTANGAVSAPDMRETSDADSVEASSPVISQPVKDSSGEKKAQPFREELNNAPSESETSEASVTDFNSGKKIPTYKIIALIILVALGILFSVLIIVKNKRPEQKKKRTQALIFIVALVMAGAACIALTDIQSTDTYYNEQTLEKSDPEGTVTITIRCDNIYTSEMADPANPPQKYTDNSDPSCLLEVTEFPVWENETVFDLLVEVARKNRIIIFHRGTTETAYIEGINNLKEFDYGDLSGWIYTVNGVQAPVGCGSYILHDGDAVEWHYTLDLGHDVP